MVIPLFVGREKSVKALEVAMDGNKQIFLAAQRSASDDNPEIDDIYTTGTLSNILQLLKLPDGTIKVLVEGGNRAKVTNFTDVEEYFAADVELIEPAVVSDRESEVLTRSLMAQFDQYVKLNKKIPLRSFHLCPALTNPRGSATPSQRTCP